MADPLIWALCDDRPGTAAQVLGVAEALGCPFVEKQVRYDGLARLPNLLRGASLIGIDRATRASLAPPWPDAVISAGRRTAPVARWIKHHAGKPVILAHLMNPGRRGADEFDLIALPNHDCLAPGGDAANILRIVGAPHRVTPARLAQAATSWAPSLSGLPRPFIAVLVGGATRRRPFPAATASRLGAQVSAMARAVGGSVLLCTSRRTGRQADAALAAAVGQPSTAFFWSRGGDNPYLGYIALADAIVVTGDSVSMACEACATAAPVFIFAPEGFAAPKHRRLHRELIAGGFARSFDGVYAEWTHPALNSAGDVAARLERLIPSSLQP